MLNQLVLVGRLTDKPEIVETEEGKKFGTVTLAVPRSFKNEEGVYETDFIPCVLYNGTVQQVSEWCKKGDLVGVKGRVQAEEGKIQLIAEKVTFLSTKKGDE